MSADKLRFTGEEQRRFLNRTESIQRRARSLYARSVWIPEPLTRKEMRRVDLMRELMASWAQRRMGWQERP